MHRTTPYNRAPWLDNDLSQIDLSQSNWMPLRTQWMKQFFNRETERKHCSSVTWAFCNSTHRGNASIVGKACACLGLCHPRWQIDRVWLLCSTDRGQEKRRTQSLFINYTRGGKEGSPCLCPLSEQEVGGAAARSGFTKRQEFDPGVSWASSSLLTLLPSFLQLWQRWCKQRSLCAKGVGRLRQCCCCCCC